MAIDPNYLYPSYPQYPDVIYPYSIWPIYPYIWSSPKHAEKCPICNGSGEIEIDLNRQSTSAPYKKLCHGCGGRGWIEVG